RDSSVTGVQTCALPISPLQLLAREGSESEVRREIARPVAGSPDDRGRADGHDHEVWPYPARARGRDLRVQPWARRAAEPGPPRQIGRASCRERDESTAE